MADSIFNRPMFAAGQYADPVTPKKGAPTEQVKFGFDDVYKSDFMPFDAEGVASLMNTYAQPEATRQAYEEFAGTPKSSEEFAAEYDSMYPETESVNENFGFGFKPEFNSQKGVDTSSVSPGQFFDPVTLLLLGSGLIGLAGLGRKKI